MDPPQGIIDPTRTETFAKEPKLATILQKLKPPPVSSDEKKSAGFGRMSVTPCLLRLGALLRGNL